MQPLRRNSALNRIGIGGGRSPIRKQVRARSVFCALTRHPIGDTSKQVDDCSGTGASRQRNVERRFAIEHRLGAVEEFAGIAAVPINIEREDIDIPSRASRSPSLLVKCQVADFLRRSSVALGISRNLNRGSSGATEPASRTRALTAQPPHDRVGETEAGIFPIASMPSSVSTVSVA